MSLGEVGAGIRRLSLAEARRRRAELAGIYQRAFGYDDDKRDHFAGSLAEGLTYDGAMVLAAHDEAGQILGFAYGFTFTRGHWWPERVAPWLEQAGLGEWMLDTFELVEVEVDPAHHGHGLGTALLTMLFEQCGHSRILLGTSADPANRAPALYHRLGFLDLLPGFHYPNGVPARIMGRIVDRS